MSDNLNIQLGEEVANGHLNNAYKVQFPFSIEGRQYFYGQNQSTYSWFIQEILPGGKMGEKTAEGVFNNAYEVQFPFFIKGRQYFYGQNQSTNYWFIQELLPGGLMGEETANGHFDNAYGVQFPFSIEGRQYFYGQNQSTNYWFIQELLPGGLMGEETVNGHFDNAYGVQFTFSINECHYIYGQNQSTNYWFIQELLPGGLMGEEVSNGYLDSAYGSQFLYPTKLFGHQYFYGQDQSSKRWFVRELLEEGKMGEEVMQGYWNNAYSVQFSFEIGDISYFFAQNQNTNYWFVQELLSSTEYTIKSLPRLNLPSSAANQRPSNNFKSSYPVGWLPYLADWKRYVKEGGPIFKYHNPESIEGVGVLLPMVNGKLYGNQLKRQITEELKLYAQSEGHYSWVLVPGGKILYKWNSQLALDSRDYTRHSDLNAGLPVTCAGEFYLTRKTSFIFLNTLYIEINDSSGHYKPDGNVCFRYVLDQFAELGIKLDNVILKTRDA